MSEITGKNTIPLIETISLNFFQRSSLRVGMDCKSTYNFHVNPEWLKNDSKSILCAKWRVRRPFPWNMLICHKFAYIWLVLQLFANFCFLLQILAIINDWQAFWWLFLGYNAVYSCHGDRWDFTRHLHYYHPSGVCGIHLKKKKKKSCLVLYD